MKFLQGLRRGTVTGPAFALLRRKTQLTEGGWCSVLKAGRMRSQWRAFSSFLPSGFSLVESPPGLEEGNVCFIFCLALQGLLGAGVFLLASDSASLNTVAFSP